MFRNRCYDKKRCLSKNRVIFSRGRLEVGTNIGTVYHTKACRAKFVGEAGKAQALAREHLSSKRQRSLTSLREKRRTNQIYGNDVEVKAPFLRLRER